MTDWTDSNIQQFVQDIFLRENHNSLCLAHGRKPIMPVRIKFYSPKNWESFLNIPFYTFQYSSSPYPKFKSLEKTEDFKCAMNSPQESSSKKLKIDLYLIFVSIIAYYS